MSQPSWAAWIEISIGIALNLDGFSRSPLGLRGLKCPFLRHKTGNSCRSPLGLRGLKSCGFF